MMLLTARAATCRLTIGSIGLYGRCRFSDQATWPPWAGVIGSRPCRPVFGSLNWLLLPLVMRAKTHRIWLVSLPQAKLTCAGSDATLEFLQAVSIWLCTLATLDGQPGLDRKMNSEAMVITAATPATAITPLRDFGILARPAPARLALRRPRSMSA